MVQIYLAVPAVIKISLSYFSFHPFKPHRKKGTWLMKILNDLITSISDWWIWNMKKSRTIIASQVLHIFTHRGQLSIWLNKIFIWSRRVGIIKKKSFFFVTWSFLGWKIFESSNYESWESGVWFIISQSKTNLSNEILPYGEF